MLFRNEVQCEANALGLAREVRLAVNVDKLTELAIIMLKEHWEYMSCREKRL